MRSRHRAAPPHRESHRSDRAVWLGGARLGPAALRVTLGGSLAMGVTAAIGRLLGVTLS